MNNIHEARLAIAELLDDFAHKSLSPCTTLALGNLVLVAGLHDELWIAPARRRAGERGKTVLEHAFEMAMDG